MSSNPAIVNDDLTSGPAHRVKAFGLSISELDVIGVARYIASSESLASSSARLLVTPNIQHIALMRRDAPFRAAMEAADLVTCDGFPVVFYARLRGCPVPGRITGREIVDHLMHEIDFAGDQRLFFLVDSEETAQAVQEWNDRRSRAVDIRIEVAPMGFGTDAAYCDALVTRIRDYGTSLLFLGVGAPRSELFAAQYRHKLGRCWALCIGQSIKIALGRTPLPPPLMQRLNLEWMWRLRLEPRRLFARYAGASFGYMIAVASDLIASRREQRERQTP